MSKSTEQEVKPSSSLGQISVIEENPEELTPALHRSNYALEFRNSNNENNSKKSLERNITGFVNNCVRSSLNEISYANQDNNARRFSFSYFQ